jgi:hypothetical protein
MIKNFTDKNNRVYDIILRGSFQDSIKSAKKLKEVLDKACTIESIRKVYPSITLEHATKLSESLNKKTYRDIMSIFGICSNAIFKGSKPVK